MKKIIYLALIAVIFGCFSTSCEKEKYSSSKTADKKSITLVENCNNEKGSINPYDNFNEGIKAYLDTIYSLIQDNFYQEEYEEFMQKSIKLSQSLNMYPLLTETQLQNINLDYLFDLLESFVFVDNPEEVLEKAINAENDVIQNITECNEQNTYLEIISIYKYYTYHSLSLYRELSFSERYDNCIGWELYYVYSSPVKVVAFIVGYPESMAVIAAHCLWLASCRPSHHDCQEPHPEEW